MGFDSKIYSQKQSMGANGNRNSYRVYGVSDEGTSYEIRLHAPYERERQRLS